MTYHTPEFLGLVSKGGPGSSTIAQPDPEDAYGQAEDTYGDQDSYITKGGHGGYPDADTRDQDAPKTGGRRYDQDVRGQDGGYSDEGVRHGEAQQHYRRGPRNDEHVYE